MTQPVGDRRRGVKVVALGEGGHGAAGGVLARDDVGDAQGGGVVDVGRDPVRAGGLGGSEVRGGADDEQFARLAAV